MDKLIFQEVWWELKSISICYITMFLILWNQVNVRDVVNKSSVSAFVIITTISKKNSGVVVVQESFTWHARTSTDQLQYLKRFYLTFQGLLRLKLSPTSGCCPCWLIFFENLFYQNNCKEAVNIGRGQIRGALFNFTVVKKCPFLYLLDIALSF